MVPEFESHGVRQLDGVRPVDDLRLGIHHRHAMSFGGQSVRGGRVAVWINPLSRIGAMGHQQPHDPEIAGEDAPQLPEAYAAAEPLGLPPLFSSYLKLGAKVCGGPALVSPVSGVRAVSW